jgi:hypothetical protein
MMLIASVLYGLTQYLNYLMYLCASRRCLYLSFYGLSVYCTFSYWYFISTWNSICVWPCKWILMFLCVVVVVGRTADLYYLVSWHLFSPWTTTVYVIMSVSGPVGRPTLTSVDHTVIAVWSPRPSEHLLRIWLSLSQMTVRNQYVFFYMLFRSWEIHWNTVNVWHGVKWWTETVERMEMHLCVWLYKQLLCRLWHWW